MLETLTTPCVIVDLDIVEANIARMAGKLATAGIAHRPHIKTHKSVELGRKQLAAGAIGITVAKLGEAKVFADAGYDNILLAYPVVGADKLARYEALHRHVNIMTTIDSMHVAEGLANVGLRCGKPVQVLVEIDVGMHRCGVQPEDAVTFAKAVQRLQGIEIVGVMEYNAVARNFSDDDGLRGALRKELATVRRVVDALRAAGVEVRVVSVGSTVAGTFAEDLAGVTEVRAGSYIYQDVTALAVGIADVADCAIRVLTTVVSTPCAGRASVDAGSKTLTSDRAAGRDGYGLVVGYPQVQVAGLSEEHGQLQYDAAVTPLKVGDRLEIIPNHGCVLSNLADVVYGVRGGEVVGPIRVDARGKNQ